ncbi:MFS transporter [Pontivivens ytuae]|nr:MFS transporter [Pontivivens ytuae]
MAMTSPEADDLRIAMTGMAAELEDAPPETRMTVLRRSAIIATVAFLTLIDLFGSQALLPTLTEAYGVSSAAMGVAVNASTIGMAAASLLVALFSRRINRKRGIWICLACLSVPTALLGVTEDLTTFTLLRIAQGVFMSTAFALTLTYLSEECHISAIGGAMAAYITGNVASNLLGRMLASGVADNIGLSESFFTFSALNLAGAIIAYRFIGAASPPREDQGGGAGIGTMLALARDRALRGIFAIGFIVLFVFVAVFTYVNFVISAPPFELPQIAIGFVYLVFAPSILTTPLAAVAFRRYGARRSFLASMAVTLVGLGLVATPMLITVLAGLTLIGAGLFFGQSIATAYIGRMPGHDHAVTNGVYLAFYYVGGIVGAFVVGQIFEAVGWTAAIALLAVLILIAAWLGRAMER